MEETIRNVTAHAVQQAGLVVQKRGSAITALLLKGLMFISATSIGSYMPTPIDRNSMMGQPLYTTSVRVYAGSNPAHGDEWNLGGHAPDVSLWTETGFKIGHGFGYRRPVAQGAFFDLIVPHHPKVQNARPHYLSLNSGGNDAICIAGLEVTYPDGQGVTITGDLLKRCSAAGAKVDGKDWVVNTESKTQMGFENNPPACFFLDRDHNYPHLWMSGISFRLPDFQPTSARAEAWSKHPEQLCGPSPRMFPREGKVDVKTPVPVWDPPFETNPDGTDRDPKRVAEWSKLPKKSKKYSLHGRDLIDDDLQIVDEDQLKEEHEHERSHGTLLADQPRQLVVSHRANFSATDQCRRGMNVGEDYVSMSERVFCDMKSRNMWHVCDRVYTRGCFDSKRNVLRGFVETHEDENDRYSAGVHSMIVKREDPAISSYGVTLESSTPPTATTRFSGALYGMRYAQVTVLE